MNEFRISELALEELAAILEYISRDSPLGAENVSKDLKRTFEAIALFPNVGRVANIAGKSRRWIAGFGSAYAYLIYFDRVEETTMIARIVHSARDQAKVFDRRIDEKP
ncbi:MAG: type II toxin-antitoxin system RelE/ParE family toxin [Planctomycetes bacterium]|nr:type II toxin-antitoxin system RelE/ParE family toxin [Planctomycetota bacterium]